MKGSISKEMFDCVPEINFNSGYRYFLGNMDNYNRALLATLKSIRSKLLILQSMSISGEYEGLRNITQTLRKMLGNIGATEIAEASYQLETALLNEDMTYVEEQMDTYIFYLMRLSDHLELLLKKMDVKHSAKPEEEQVSFLHYDFTKTKESIKLSSDLLERKII